MPKNWNKELELVKLEMAVKNLEEAQSSLLGAITNLIAIEGTFDLRKKVSKASEVNGEAVLATKAALKKLLT